MSTHRTILVGVVVCACRANHGLGEVPIVGANAATETAIREIVDGFERQTGGDRVRLSRIEVVPVDPASGNYGENAQRVRIDPSVAMEDLGSVVRHELCHALDFQNPDLLAGWASEVLADVADGLELADVQAADCDPDCWVHEAFASVCALGPWTAHATVDPCDSDASSIQRVSEVLALDVWWTPDGPLQRLPTDVAASIDIGDSVTMAFGLGLVEPNDSFVLSWEDSTATTRKPALDLNTGLERDVTNEQRLAAVIHPGLFGQPQLESGLAPLSPLGWIDGPVAARMSIDWLHLGQVERMVVARDDTWDLIEDGCAAPTTPLPYFAAGDREIYVLWTDDTVVGWKLLPD